MSVDNHQEPGPWKPPYPVRASGGPCRVCKREIQPRQSYVVTRRGPVHVYCRPRGS